MELEIEVFRTGRWTDASGVTRLWTASDLEAIAAAYNAQYPEHEAPLVLGHPESDHPAYGWVSGLRRVKNRLYAVVRDVADGLREAVRRRAYKKVSIALYPDNLLRHVGLLEAVPPAIRGLSPVQFDGGRSYRELVIPVGPVPANAQVSTPESTMSGLFKRLHDFIKDRYGEETAERLAPIPQAEAVSGDQTTDEALDEAPAEDSTSGSLPASVADSGPGFSPASPSAPAQGAISTPAAIPHPDVAQDVAPAPGTAFGPPAPVPPGQEPPRPAHGQSIAAARGRQPTHHPTPTTTEDNPMPEPTRDPAPRFVAATAAAVDPRSATPPAESETLEAELRRVREENERLRLELEDLRQQLEQLRQEASLGEFRSFTEELIRQGRALPAEREELEDEFRDLMRAQQALTFSEREVDLIGRQRRRLERRPVLYSSPGRHFATAERAAAPAIDVPDRFRAVAGRVDPESAELDRRLRSYVQRHGCSYEDAYSALAAQRG